MNSTLKWLCLSFALLSSTAGVAAERIALVVGNSAYRSQPLSSPGNDAKAIGELLKTAGFVVDTQLDTSRASVSAAITAFGNEVRKPETKFAVFFYAGHGVQILGRNYLIPIDASISAEKDINQQAVELVELLTHMNNTQKKIFLVVLDACRDDPFAGKFLPKDKGLNGVDQLAGTMLAFATAPGKVALEFDGQRNGLYTSKLLNEMQVKGARLEDVFKRTRIAVRVASKGMQIPWENTSLEEDVVLFPTQTSKMSEADLTDAMQKQLTRWNQIKASKSIEDFRSFLHDFPSGFFTEHASTRLNALVDEDRKRTLAADVQKRKEQEAKAYAESQAALKKFEEEERANELLEQQRAKAEQQRLAAVAAEQNARMQLEAAAAVAQAQRLDAQRRADEAAKAAEAARALAAQRAAQIERELQAQRDAVAKAAAQKESAQKIAQTAQKQTTDLIAIQSETAPVHVAGGANTSGYSERRRDYRVGDQIAYRVLDRMTRRERQRDLKVTKVDSPADRVEFNDGAFVSDLMGNILTNEMGSGASPRQFYPSEIFVGKKWTTRYTQYQPSQAQSFTFDYQIRVVALERISVPAGTFDAYKIEAKGRGVEARSQIERTIWVVPGMIGDVANETRVWLQNGKLFEDERRELVSVRRG